MPIIDVWAQQPTERFIKQPYFESLRRWTNQQATTIAIETTAQLMQHAGINKAFLSAWYAPEGDLISNDDVLQAVKAFPDLFIGMASADIRHPVKAQQTIRHYVTEHGFKAVRLVQWLWELPITHALYYPILAECVQLDVPICLQVGHTGPLKSSESGKPTYIERIALDFPELKIVCGHIGYPWHVEMIACATKFENVYIDTSAYKPNRYPAELVDYMKAHGTNKVLFGTNFPMIMPTDCVAQLDVLGLSEEQSEQFLYKNAERVFAVSV